MLPSAAAPASSRVYRLSRVAGISNSSNGDPGPAAGRRTARRGGSGGCSSAFVPASQGSPDTMTQAVSPSQTSSTRPGSAAGLMRYFPPG